MFNHSCSRITVICLLIMLSTIASAADMPIFKQYDNWDIRVDTTLNNSCFMMGIWEGGSVLRFGVNKNQGNMYLMLGDNDWKSLESGKEYDLSIKLGNKSPWTAPSTAVGLGEGIYLWINIPADAAKDFMAEFMKQHDIEADYNNKNILHLKLTGSYEAATGLMECQKLFNSKAETKDPFLDNNESSDNDPFAY